MSAVLAPGIDGVWWAPGEANSAGQQPSLIRRSLACSFPLVSTGKQSRGPHSAGGIRLN